MAPEVHASLRQEGDPTRRPNSGGVQSAAWRLLRGGCHEVFDFGLATVHGEDGGFSAKTAATARRLAFPSMRRWLFRTTELPQ